MTEANDVAERLIVALDVPEIVQARALVGRLGQTVSFYKIGLWLFFQPGVDGLIDDLLAAGKQVFLDCKMYDIGETVRRGVAAAAKRGVAIVTVHGDPDILRAAVDGREDSALKVFAISVLTSQDDAALRAMGYDRPLQDLIDLRVRAAAEAGCDGVIASAADDPNALRAKAGRPDLLIGTPGIRLRGADPHDQKRAATPDEAVARGADYLVVGRPITQASDPAAAARQVIALMEQGWARRSRAAQ
ncbi:MAG: orotidine-5'-phosphate decarboxylase [Acetobacteraceae bacterium]|nr:orotidine-5'-phosphate decarboxylase [Acetobacteraceae bacterium]